MLLVLFPFIVLNNAMAFVYSEYAYFYAPTLKKWGAYCFRLVRLSVHLCVRVSVHSKKFKARVLKFHTWIPRPKIAYPYFLLYELYPLVELCPF